MVVVLENELERKLSVGPGLNVDKTTLVLVKHTIHHCPQDCDTPVAYLQDAISENLSTLSIFNLCTRSGLSRVIGNVIAWQFLPHLLCHALHCDLYVISS